MSRRTCRKEGANAQDDGEQREIDTRFARDDFYAE